MNKKFSIIIALAPDRKIEVVESFKRMDFPIDEYEVIVKVGLSPSVNRNSGVKEARGDIFAFVDDDCAVEKDWLKKAEGFFAEYPQMDAVGGPQLTPGTDGFFAKASGYALASVFGTFRMSNRYKKGRLRLNVSEAYITSANMFVRREIFEKIKGFDERLHPNEETELLVRIQKAGGRIAYSPDIIVYHRRRPDPPAFIKQCFRYGIGRSRQDEITGARFHIFTLLPCVFLYYLLVCPFLMSVSLMFLLPLFAYASLSIFVSLKTCIENRDYKTLVLLPFLFLAVHLSYGAGITANYLLKKTRLFKK